MSPNFVHQVLAQFSKTEFDYVRPRKVYVKPTFNQKGTRLYYYVPFKDSCGINAALDLEMYPDKVRFTNWRKPKKNYEDRFNSFIRFHSCTYQELEDLFVYMENPTATNLEDSLTISGIDAMSDNWGIKRIEMLNTLQVAYELLWDAEHNNWIGEVAWDCGIFIG